MTYEIYPEEAVCSEEEVAEFEELTGIKLPKDYRNFLLQYNGGLPMPNHPKPFDWSIDRFLSIGDLLQQELTENTHRYYEMIRENERDRTDLNCEKLLAIASCSRGALFIAYDEQFYGRVYAADYNGGEGMHSISLEDFDALLENLSTLEPYEDNLPLTDTKIFESEFFNSRTMGLERFKRVLKYYGDPNRKHPSTRKNVIQHWAFHEEIRDYLLSIGASTDGLLVFVDSFETIQYLVKLMGLDINKAYEGRYPIFSYLSSATPWHTKQSYQLINLLLKSDIYIDWAVRSKFTGRTAEETREMLFKEYEEVIKKYPW